jgi:4-aminobutyrate aminotransferase-like enzyme
MPELELPDVRTALPGPRSTELLSVFDARHIGVHDHTDVPFVMSAQRAWLIEDVDGNTFADHVSAWGSTPLRGTNRVVERVIEAERSIGLQNTAYTISEPVVRLLERLAQIAPPGLDRVAYSLSGTLAVEGGIKLAREATGRPMILAFLGQYHGESTYLTAGTSTDLSEVSTQHSHFVPGLVFIPYPNRYRSPLRRGAGPFDDTHTLDYLEDWVLVHQVEPEQIAGVLIEPVLGEGGIVVPSRGFWDRLHAMCAKWGWKLILDEVQTGMGRCGTMFAAERYDIRPDLVLLGKGFSGGGQPIGAILGTEEVMGRSILHLGGTFAWTPPSAAGALENIETILEDGILDNVLELERMRSRRWASSFPELSKSATCAPRVPTSASSSCRTRNRSDPPRRSIARCTRPRFGAACSGSRNGASGSIACSPLWTCHRTCSAGRASRWPTR